MALVEMVMPKMGESIMEGTILKWLKKEGDRIEQDEAVLEVATDKVDTEVPATHSGVLKQILANEGDVVEVGKPIAVINTSVEAEAPAPQPAQSPKAPEVEPAEDKETVKYAAAIESSVESMRNGSGSNNGVTRLPEPAVGRFYSPLVLTIAREENIPMHELEYIPGSWADNRVTKKDILTYVNNRKQVAEKTEQPRPEPSAPTPKPTVRVESPAYSTANASPNQYRDESPEAKPEPEQTREAPVNPPQPEPKRETPEYREMPQPKPAGENQIQPVAKPTISYSGRADIVEMDRMRKMIAQRMVDSKRISPHVTSFVEADVTNIVYWRNRVKNEFKSREGDTLTYTPVFIEAIAKAIKDYPMVNASVDGDKIIVKKDINVGMAVALPNGNLIVPVIKGVDQLNIIGITKRVNDLARRARENKLSPDDLSDGTYTMSNVGSFGNVMGTPIIVQPQIAIMAFGAIQKKPAVIESPFGDTIGIRHFMFLSHSYDHRVVDGALGGMFVRRVADYLEGFDVNRQIFG